MQQPNSEMLRLVNDSDPHTSLLNDPGELWALLIANGFRSDDYTYLKPPSKFVLSIGKALHDFVERINIYTRPPDGTFQWMTRSQVSRKKTS